MKFDSKKISDIEYVFPQEQKHTDSIIANLQKGKLSNGQLIRHFISGRMTNEDYFVDVGCHIGSTALWIGDYQSRTNNIIAIDGCKQAIDCLQESIRRNKLTNIEAVHAIVSHSNFPASIPKSVNQESIITASVPWYKKFLYKNLDFLHAKTLDEIIGDRKCSLIKITVNGFESGVLSGAVNILERDGPVLLIEWNSGWGTMGHLLDTLQDLNYDAFFLNEYTGNLGSQTKTLIPALTSCKNCGSGYFLCYPTDHPKYGLYVDTRKVSNQ